MALLLYFDDDAADRFRDLRDERVAERAQSVHPAG
jgi:hypothetical protein